MADEPHKGLNDWPKYQSPMIVRAMPITGITPSGVLLVGARHEPFVTTDPALGARALVGWYAIVYEDGFKCVSPKKAFEDGYTRIA